MGRIMPSRSIGIYTRASCVFCQKSKSFNIVILVVVIAVKLYQN